MLKYLSLLIIVAFIFSGCSTRTVVAIAPEPEPLPVLIDTHWVSKALYKEYDKWCNTPYQYGGDDVDGVDCSSLVQSVYQDAFGIELPRTSVEQAQMGYEVQKNSSKEGDLIFFKTGRTISHAGIIIKDGHFLHASTKEGVKISQISDPYWRRTYWQTRRVLP